MFGPLQITQVKKVLSCIWKHLMQYVEYTDLYSAYFKFLSSDWLATTSTWRIWNTFAASWIATTGDLKYFFLRATKGQRQFKGRCLRTKWSSLSYVFVCILGLTKGQTRMVCGPDLARGPPFEKACATSYLTLKIDLLTCNVRSLKH